MNESLPPLHPTPAASSPKRTGWIVYAVIITFLLFVSLLTNLILFGLIFGSSESSLTTRRSRLEEQFVDGDANARDKIAVIYLTGVITSAGEGTGSDDGMVSLIKEQLRTAVDDPRVKAIVLRINSPGGEVVASDAIYNAVVAARAVKPVVACMDSVAASGAYYVAVGANRIVATDMTITGSIGVIMQTFTFSGLMQKIGVEAHTFKSGKYKDLLNPTREPTPEEEQLVQGLIMEVYNKFVGIVAKERKMNVQQLKDGLADGRILSGRQAKDDGFIDQIGYFDDAVAAAKDLAKIKQAKLIRYLTPFSWRNLFRFSAESRPTKLQLEVAPAELRLETGTLYFLPAYLYR